MMANEKNKPRYSVEAVQRMLESPKRLPPPGSFMIERYDAQDCGDVWLEYHGEYLARQLTRLRREKALLRAALKETIQTIYRSNDVSHTYWSTRWEEHILNLTEDKEPG